MRAAEDVRTVLAYARSLYEYQDFIYIGEYGEDGFVVDYASKVRAAPEAPRCLRPRPQWDKRNILW